MTAPVIVLGLAAYGALLLWEPGPGWRGVSGGLIKLLIIGLLLLVLLGRH